METPAQMVRLYKEQFGRGPTKVRTDFAGPGLLSTVDTPPLAAGVSWCDGLIGHPDGGLSRGRSSALDQRAWATILGPFPGRAL